MRPCNGYATTLQPMSGGQILNNGRAMKNDEASSTEWISTTMPGQLQPLSAEQALQHKMENDKDEDSGDENYVLAPTHGVGKPCEPFNTYLTQHQIPIAEQQLRCCGLSTIIEYPDDEVEGSSKGKGKATEEENGSDDSKKKNELRKNTMKRLKLAAKKLSISKGKGKALSGTDKNGADKSDDDKNGDGDNADKKNGDSKNGGSGRHSPTYDSQAWRRSGAS